MTQKILFFSAHNPYSEGETRLLPLWPAYLASYTEKHLGPGSLCFRYAGADFEQTIRYFKPDLIAMSSVTKNYGYAIKCASVAKKYGLPVIFGGPHITAIPGTLADNMDVGCIGEGEQTFYELMRLYIDKGGFSPKDLEGIDGIVYHDGGQLVKTRPRVPMETLDALPHPERSITGYRRRGYIHTARGCNYKCIFCSCSRHWSGIRFLPAEYVIEEVRELVKSGVKVIRFNDDNFAANKKRLMQISELIVKHGFQKKVKFSCWCRSNDVTPEITEALKAMNMVSVKIGLESGNQKTLKFLKGNVTVEDNVNAVRLFKNAGLQVNGDFIIGAPDETIEDMMETYKFIKDSGVDFVDINVLTPLPGTPLWALALRKKIITADVDWRTLDFTSGRNAERAPMLSEKLTRQELLRIYRKFQRLRFIKTILAIPHSPWLDEFPPVALGRIKGAISGSSFSGIKA